MHGCSAGSSRWPASWPPCWAVPPTSSPGKAPSASSADPRARRLHGPARPESPAKSAGSLGRRAQFKLSGGRDSAGTSFHCPGCPGLPGPTARQSRPAAGGPQHAAPVAWSKFLSQDPATAPGSAHCSWALLPARRPAVPPGNLQSRLG